MTYTLVPKVLPGKEDGQRLYYAQSRARGELGLEEMAERISRNCTLTRSDIIGVLAALEEKSDKPEPVKPFRSYYDKDGDAR
mgnify:CR=1 FL=1